MDAKRADRNDGVELGERGRRLAGYEVIGSLGGRAGARLCRRVDDGMLVVLRTPLAPAEAEGFRRRARALIQVRHPALVPIVELGELPNGMPFLAEEYRGGGSLRELVASLRGVPIAEARPLGRDRLPGSGSFEARAAALGARIADALDALHAAGLAHGAVRPAAVLFTRGADGECEVALGGYRLDEAARWCDGLGYAAPEQVHDHGPPTQAADLIGLAATLYELFTLRPAFVDRKPGGLARAVREHEPQRPTTLQPFLRPEADAVLLQAMEKRPARRPESASAFAEDLRALAAGRSVVAKLPPFWRRALGRLRERRRDAAALGALAVVLVLAEVLRRVAA